MAAQMTTSIPLLGDGSLPATGCRPDRRADRRDAADGGWPTLVLLLISVVGGCANSPSVTERPCCAAPAPGALVVHVNGAVGGEWSYTHR
jgi:hypothetical protein